MKDIFIYNIEPCLALPVNEEERMKGIEYCQSADDFAHMGISCLGGVHIDLEDREIISTIAAPWSAATRNFIRRTASNPDTLIGGFNVHKFEDLLLNQNGLSILSDFDLRQVVLMAAAQSVETYLPSDPCYTLDKIGAFNNFPDFHHKQIAPYLYQQNEIELMLAHAQEAALVQAQTLLMLLDGILIDPNTTCFLKYQFPKEITNICYD